MVPEASSHGVRRPELLLLAMMAVVLVAAAYLTSPNMFSGADFLRIHTFYKSYLRESQLSGRLLPLWNPYVNLGRPFLADADSAVLYPPDLLYLVLDVRWAWTILAMAHVWFGMVGVTLWLRAMGGGTRLSLGLAVVAMFTAPFVETFQGGLIHYAIGLTYLPWVFLFSLRLQDARLAKNAAILACLVALQYLGGHPQVTWIAGVGVTLFLLVRRLAFPLRRTLPLVALDLAMLGGCFAWGFALAAVQLLPTLELAAHGNRHASLAFSASFSLPLHALYSLLQPLGPRFPLDGATNLFCGTGLLIAGTVGLTRVRDRNARALLVIAVFSVLLALGEVTPFFRICYAVLPGCSVFRLHSRMMVLFIFALVSASGLFLSQPPLLSRAQRPDVVFAVASTAVLLCVALLDWGVLPAPLKGKSHAEAWLRVGLVAFTIILLWLWQNRARFVGSLRASLVVVLLLLGVAAELSLSLLGIKQIREHRAPEATERVLGELLAHNKLLVPGAAPPRVAFPMPYVRENAGMKYGFSAFSGYVSLTLDRVFAFTYGMRGLVEPLTNTFPAENVYGGGPFPFASMNLQVGFDPDRKRAFLDPRPDPRLYLAPHHRVVDNWRQALSLMKRGHDFHDTVLLEHSIELPGGGDPTGRPVRGQILNFAPERIQIETESPNPAWLVLAEAWYPGWMATVDGQPAPCLPGNVWMRVIPVPSGVHQVVLVYRSTYLGLGMAVSLLSLLAVLAVGWRSRGTCRPPCTPATSVKVPRSRRDGKARLVPLPGE